MIDILPSQATAMSSLAVGLVSGALLYHIGVVQNRTYSDFGSDVVRAAIAVILVIGAAVIILYDTPLVPDTVLLLSLILLPLVIGWYAYLTTPTIFPPSNLDDE